MRDHIDVITHGMALVEPVHANVEPLPRPLSCSRSHWSVMLQARDLCLLCLCTIYCWCIRTFDPSEQLLRQYILNLGPNRSNIPFSCLGTYLML